MPRAPTLLEQIDTFREENRRRARTEHLLALRYEGFSHTLVMDLARDGARVEDDQLSPAAAIVASYKEQQDIYEHGLQPGDMKTKKSGRKRQQPRKGQRWYRPGGLG